MQIFLGGGRIIKIKSQDVTNTQDVSDVMNRHQAGDTVTVTFFRGQKKMTTRVTLGEAHEQAA
jgi:S1-C subfamily serine protease